MFSVTLDQAEGPVTWPPVDAEVLALVPRWLGHMLMPVDLAEGVRVPPANVQFRWRQLARPSAPPFLATLPESFETLVHAYFQRPCRQCGELGKPFLCLLCGDLYCRACLPNIVVSVVIVCLFVCFYLFCS